MLGGFLSAIALVAAASALSAQSGPVAGRNVNIVGGPATLSLNPFDLVGDPFGGQQNEGSCAFSPRSLHILCGANDYRAIDLPGIDAEKIPGDAFAGVFQSRDGGLSWESRLHPGFQLDSTDSVLKPFPAIADSVVRIGPAGLGFYSGIAFERTESRLGLLFVSTWMDLLAQEGDRAPFKHVRTVMVDGGHAGKFIDKPWMALGTPIPGQTCTLDVPAGDGTTVRQTVPRTPIYLAWAVFPASSDETASAKIHFSRSTDCGVSFSPPVDLSAGNILNQGVQVTVVPFTDDVYVSWRRGATATQGDALMVRRSGNGGASFSAPIAVAARTPSGGPPSQGFLYCPFDQGTTPYTFRTTAFPTMAAGAGRAFMFWSQRQGDCNSGTARIVMSSTTNGTSWTAPVRVDSPQAPGHQIMPTATVAGSTLQVAWFDFRSDASGLFGSAIEEFSIVDAGTVLPPTAANPRRRHTADVRGAQASLGLLAPATLTFTPYPVSQYIFGIPPGTNPATGMPYEKQQLQFNPVNVRMFKKMTVPFISDYLDFAAPQYAPAHPVYLPGIWAPNAGQHGDTPSMVAWTDMRNVKLFVGEQYVDSQGNPVPRPFTRKTLPGQGAESLIDPTINVPQCVPGPLGNELYTGTKNQDVFVAPVFARGWFAAAAWNNKPLGFAATPLPDGTRPLLQRAFAVFARNITAQPKQFRVRVANQPSGGRASFDQFSAQTQIVIDVPARSMVARSVFVEAPAKRAAVAVDFNEIVNNTLGPGFMRVWLNPDPSAPESLLLPESVPPTEDYDITNFEVYDIGIGQPTVQQGPLTPGLNNTEWENPEWENPEWENPEWENPEWENPEWENPEWENPEWENPEWENPEWENAAADDQIKQFQWRVENIGNTTTAYSSKVAILGQTGATTEFQLVVYKLYTTPATNTCDPHRLVGHTQVLANVTNLDVSTANFERSDWENSSAAFYSLEPGEVAYVALQMVGPVPVLDAITTDNTVLGIQPQGVDTIDKLAGQTEPEVKLSLGIAPANLPQGSVDATYPATTLSAFGGTPGYSWSMAGETSLAPGLTLSETGVISGTPTQSGTFVFDIRVTDSSTPENQTATRRFTIAIVGATPNLAFVAQPSDAITMRSIVPAVRVRAQDQTGAVLPGRRITIAIGQNPGEGMLSGTTTATTDETGIATFAGLSINQPGNGYTLVATSGGGSATSHHFNISSISFEMLPDGTPACVSCPIAQQFASRGVTFSFAGDVNPDVTTVQLVDSTSVDPAGPMNHSIRNPNLTGPGGGSDVGIMKLQLVNARPQVAFRLRGPAWVPNQFTPFIVTAFDASNNEISSEAFMRSGGTYTPSSACCGLYEQETISIASGAGIARVEINARGRNIFLDNLALEPQLLVNFAPPPGTGAGDFIDRGFYHPSYPGSTLDSVDLWLTSFTPGTYTISLAVRKDAYNGQLLGTSAVTVNLQENVLTPATFVFSSPIRTTPGTLLTFAMTQTAPGTPPLLVYYAVDSGCDSNPNCANPTIETEGTTPPLDTRRRKGVYVRMFGQ
jgi:hypothetical protein